MANFNTYKILQGSANTQPRADTILGSNGTQAVIKYNGLIDALNLLLGPLESLIDNLEGDIITINQNLSALTDRVLALENNPITLLNGDSFTVHIELPAVKSYYIDSGACNCYTIDAINNIYTTEGSAIVSLQVNGVNVSGLSNLNINNIESTSLPTSPPTILLGDTVTLNVTEITEATDLVMSICVTKVSCPSTPPPPTPACPLTVTTAGDGVGGSVFSGTSGFFTASGFRWSGYIYKTGGGGTLFSPQSNITAVLQHTGSNFDHVEFGYIWEGNYSSTGNIPDIEVITSNNGFGNYNNIVVTIRALARQGDYLFISNDSVSHNSGIDQLFILPTTNFVPWYDKFGSTHTETFNTNAETEWGFLLIMDGGDGSHNLGQLLVNSVRLQNVNRCQPIHRPFPLLFNSVGYSCPEGLDFVVSEGSNTGDQIQFSSNGTTGWTTVFTLTEPNQTYFSSPVNFTDSGFYRFVRNGFVLPLQILTGETIFPTNRFDCNNGGGGEA